MLVQKGTDISRHRLLAYTFGVGVILNARAPNRRRSSERSVDAMTQGRARQTHKGETLDTTTLLVIVLVVLLLGGGGFIYRRRA